MTSSDRLARVLPQRPTATADRSAAIRRPAESWRPATAAVATLLVALSLPPGCSSPVLSPELAQMSVVAVRSPGFSPPAGTTYALLPLSRLIATDPGFRDGELEQLVTRALDDALQQRGLRKASGSSAEVLIGWVGAVDRDLDGHTVSELFGLDPGLVPGGGAAQRYGRGTVVVDVVRRGDRFPSWRGAVQAVAAPELDEDLRRERIERGAQMLVAEL